MADHFSFHEYLGLRGAAQHQTKTWQDLMEYARESETRKAFYDPEYFTKQMEPIFASRAREAARVSRTAMDRAAAGVHARGMGSSGVGAKLREQIGGEHVGRVAAMRAELEGAAEQKRTGAEAAYMDLMASVDAAKLGAIQAHQQMFARLGEAGYRPGQENWEGYYEAKDEFQEELYEEMGW